MTHDDYDDCFYIPTRADMYIEFIKISSLRH